MPDKNGLSRWEGVSDQHIAEVIFRGRGMELETKLGVIKTWLSIHFVVVSGEILFCCRESCCLTLKYDFATNFLGKNWLPD